MPKSETLLTTGALDARTIAMIRIAIFKDSDTPVLVTKEEALVEVNSEVDKFSDWMANLEDARARGALNSPEKALIRTYLMQKVQGKL